MADAPAGGTPAPAAPAAPAPTGRTQDATGKFVTTGAGVPGRPPKGGAPTPSAQARPDANTIGKPDEAKPETPAQAAERRKYTGLGRGGKPVQFEYTDDEVGRLAARQHELGSRERALSEDRKRLAAEDAARKEAFKDRRALAKLLQENGVDLTQISNDHLTALLDEAAMSPEQKERADFERQRAEFGKEKERLAAEDNDRRLEEAAKQLAPMMEKEIPAALIELGLPLRNPTVIGLMDAALTEYMGSGEDVQVTPQAIRAAAAQARDEAVEMTGSFLEPLDAEGIVRLLGPERGEALANKFRERDTKLYLEKRAAQGGPAALPRQKPAALAAPTEPGRHFLEPFEVAKALREQREKLKNGHAP